MINLDELNALIRSGAKLTKAQDDAAYALLSEIEYTAISASQKPNAKEQILTLKNLNSLQNDWCVYSVNDHFLGCCKLSQMMMIPDVARLITFKNVTPESMPIKIALMEVCSSAEGAKLHYDTLLKCCDYIAPPPTPHDTLQPLKTVRCVTDGNEFASVSQAAEFYALSVTSIYNSLRGVRNAPRNLNFERI